MRHVLFALALAVLAAGCAPQTHEHRKSRTSHGHDHGDGPHGGCLAEFGEAGLHAEFTVDHGKKEAVVYVLGGDAKKAHPLKAGKLLLKIKEPAFEVELTAAPLEGEPAGASSRFVGSHEKLGKEQEFAGTITATVGGEVLSGEFEEVPEKK